MLARHEHGHARASGDATAQQVTALQHQLEDTRRELATTRAASAERDRRLAEAEAAAHGHAVSAHGASAETDALRSRADTLALSLAAAERERDEARHLLEAEKALHLKKEAEWKAAEAAHGALVAEQLALRWVATTAGSPLEKKRRANAPVFASSSTEKGPA